MLRSRRTRHSKFTGASGLLFLNSDMASFVCMQGLESTDGRMLLDPLSLSDCRILTTDATNVLIVKVWGGSHRTGNRSVKSVHAGVACADLIFSQVD